MEKMIETMRAKGFGKPEHSPYVFISARIRAKEGKSEELAQVLRRVAEESRREHGCGRYTLHQSGEDPQFFLTIEHWNSPEAVQTHLSSPHVHAALARKEELIQDLRIDTLKPL